MYPLSSALYITPRSAQSGRWGVIEDPLHEMILWIFQMESADE